MYIRKGTWAVAGMLLIAWLSLSTEGQAANFQGYDFNTTVDANILTNGDLQLTTGIGPGGSGTAWLTTPLSTTQSFSATFDFSLQRRDYYPMADGISFALQNQGTDLTLGGGGNMGYGLVPGTLNGVGSIISTWYNNKAGLNINGNAYNTKSAPANLGSANLVTGTETISYHASNSLLTMNGSLNVDGRVYNINDSVTIDLAEKFGPTMFAGFNGACGGSNADQRIVHFNISPVPVPENYAMMMAGLCLVGAIARRRKLKT